MARSFDWSPLDLSSDPVPGDPGEVSSASQSLAQTAEDIQTAIDGIRNVAGGDASSLGESKALDKFREKAEDLADKLEKAKPRYDVAATALNTYHSELDSAQDLSVQALHAAEQAKADAASAATAMTAGEDDKESPAYTRAQGDHDAAATAMSGAVTKLHDAIGIRDDAADAAKGDIHNQIEDDDVKDSFWDNMSGFADVLSNISTILGVAALLVNCIPVIGQVLSAVLGTLALITGAMAFVLHLGAAIDNGEGWSDVIFDGIGLATFGVGRLFSAGAKGAGLASRTMAWSKLSRMSGPTASRLSSGAYTFASKGPMARTMARTISTSGPFAGRSRLAIAFGPRTIAADTAAAWRTVRTELPNIGTHLTSTPAYVRSMFSGSSATSLAHVFQGESQVAESLQAIRNVGDFADIPSVANSLRLADLAHNYSVAANVTWGLGWTSTGLDNVGIVGGD